MQRRIVATCVLLFASACVVTAQKPLSPAELEKKANAVVTGRVLSHEHEDKEEKGVVRRFVSLKVEVDGVVRGDTKPGDTIVCRCWALVKEPQNRPEDRAGYNPIPGDGGRAKLYLRSSKDGTWIIVPPNGAELLDQTPPLRYELLKGEPVPEPPPPPKPSSWELALFWAAWASIWVLVLFGLWWMMRSFRERPKPPSA